MAEEDDERRGYFSYEDEHEGQEFEDEEEEEDLSYHESAVLGTYEGQRNSNNERHGHGKTILPNGDVYVGTYMNGVRHGQGKYDFKNGGTYKGCYKEGMRNGKGVMRYPDKSKYDGYWTMNKRDGEGVYTQVNHDVYTGSWKDDKKHGLGTFKFCKTKAVLKGVWFHDKKVDNFQLFFPTAPESGFTFYGTWNDDETVDGDGYYVFEDLECMQSGIHVENPLHVKNKEADDHNRKTLWLPSKILPIVNAMLPRLPRINPIAPKRSSCTFDFPVEERTPQTTDSRVESYERRSDFWNEADEFEGESEQIEEESKSTDEQQQQQQQQLRDESVISETTTAPTMSNET